MKGPQGVRSLLVGGQMKSMIPLIHIDIYREELTYSFTCNTSSDAEKFLREELQHYREYIKENIDKIPGGKEITILVYLYGGDLDSKVTGNNFIIPSELRKSILEQSEILGKRIVENNEKRILEEKVTLEELNNAISNAEKYSVSAVKNLDDSLTVIMKYFSGIVQMGLIAEGHLSKTPIMKKYMKNKESQIALPLFISSAKDLGKILSSIKAQNN